MHGANAVDVIPALRAVDPTFRRIAVCRQHEGIQRNHHGSWVGHSDRRWRRPPRKKCFFLLATCVVLVAQVQLVRNRPALILHAGSPALPVLRDGFGFRHALLSCDLIAHEADPLVVELVPDRPGPMPAAQAPSLFLRHHGRREHSGHDHVVGRRRLRRRDHAIALLTFLIRQLLTFLIRQLDLADVG